VFNQVTPLTARTYEITFPDGFKVRKTSTDPGRALLTGYVVSARTPAPPATCLHPPCGFGTDDDWQKMDMPSLFGIAKTAPYFANNGAATLDAVLDHYDSFFDLLKATVPATELLNTVPTTPPPFDRPLRKIAEDGGTERAALVAYLNKL
jgi:hypothetical protein